MSAELRFATLLAIARLQFAILPLTPFHIALLLGAQPILLEVLLFASILFFALLLLVDALLLRLKLLALLPLAVAFLTIARSLLRALPLFLLLRRALIFGLGVALSGGTSVYLVNVLVALSICSMTLGNLVAIVQKDMKRLLAYSSISHAGYVLIGILSMTQTGYASAIFYALAYLIMNLSCFLVVVKVAEYGGDLKIAQLAGLHRRSPLLAMVLMLAVFGLAGIPPTIGFTGKFLVFAAAVEKGYLGLVILAMVNATISLYYYILVVKAAYLLEPDE